MLTKKFDFQGVVHLKYFPPLKTNKKTILFTRFVLFWMLSIANGWQCGPAIFEFYKMITLLHIQSELFD